MLTTQMTHSPSSKPELGPVVCKHFCISLDGSRLLNKRVTGAPPSYTPLVFPPPPPCGDPRVQKLAIHVQNGEACPRTRPCEAHARVQRVRVILNALPGTLWACVCEGSRNTGRTRPCAACVCEGARGQLDLLELSTLSDLSKLSNLSNVSEATDCEVMMLFVGT
jgi:hypothetical protein